MGFVSRFSARVLSVLYQADLAQRTILRAFRLMASAPASPAAARAQGRCTPGVVLFLTASLLALGAHGQDAARLLTQEEALRDQLANNQFHQPLVLESTQSDGVMQGDIYAIVTQPYTVVGDALQGADHWCDILILHINVKGCSGHGSGTEGVLSVAAGHEFSQPLELTYWVEFGYQVAASGPDYLAVVLSAAAGPLGTKDYRIVFEAIPHDTGSSFVHLSYSYAYGPEAAIALQAYLATIGRNKIGFTIAERKPDGTPVYVGNVRGVVERNTMRYYLAIEAYLDTYTLPAEEQAEKRLRYWFDAVEHYPRQLHELEREEYLLIKRRELTRQ
jgi:hypothetical protein